MEDILDLYQRPFDPRRPLVCIDELPKQLVSEVRVPLPAAPGRPARFDYEYRREGVANLFLTFEPLLGWRAVQVTARRTAVDFAEVLRWLAARLEWHYTPKHGSWLNVAEVELAALSKQCLGRRIGSAEELARAVAAWEDVRNERMVEAKWRFTTADARIKLHRLYPSIQE